MKPRVLRQFILKIELNDEASKLDSTEIADLIAETLKDSLLCTTGTIKRGSIEYKIKGSTYGVWL